MAPFALVLLALVCCASASLVTTTCVGLDGKTVGNPKHFSSLENGLSACCYVRFRNTSRCRVALAPGYEISSTGSALDFGRACFVEIIAAGPVSGPDDAPFVTGAYAWSVRYNSKCDSPTLRINSITLDGDSAGYSLFSVPLDGVRVLLESVTMVNYTGDPAIQIWNSNLGSEFKAASSTFVNSNVEALGASDALVKSSTFTGGASLAVSAGSSLRVLDSVFSGGGTVNAIGAVPLANAKISGNTGMASITVSGLDWRAQEKQALSPEGLGTPFFTEEAPAQWISLQNSGVPVTDLDRGVTASMSVQADFYTTTQACDVGLSSSGSIQQAIDTCPYPLIRVWKTSAGSGSRTYYERLTLSGQVTVASADEATLVGSGHESVPGSDVSLRGFRFIHDGKKDAMFFASASGINITISNSLLTSRSPYSFRLVAANVEGDSSAFTLRHSVVSGFDGVTVSVSGPGSVVDVSYNLFAGNRGNAISARNSSYANIAGNRLEGNEPSLGNAGAAWSSAIYAEGVDSLSITNNVLSVHRTMEQNYAMALVVDPSGADMVLESNVVFPAGGIGALPSYGIVFAGSSVSVNDVASVNPGVRSLLADVSSTNGGSATDYVLRSNDIASGSCLVDKTLGLTTTTFPNISMSVVYCVLSGPMQLQWSASDGLGRNFEVDTYSLVTDTSDLSVMGDPSAVPSVSFPGGQLKIDENKALMFANVEFVTSLSLIGSNDFTLTQSVVSSGTLRLWTTSRSATISISDTRFALAQAWIAGGNVTVADSVFAPAAETFALRVDHSHVASLSGLEVDASNVGSGVFDWPALVEMGGVIGSQGPYSLIGITVTGDERPSGLVWGGVLEPVMSAAIWIHTFNTTQWTVQQVSTSPVFPVGLRISGYDANTMMNAVVYSGGWSGAPSALSELAELGNCNVSGFIHDIKSDMVQNDWREIDAVKGAAKQGINVCDGTDIVRGLNGSSCKCSSGTPPYCILVSDHQMERHVAANDPFVSTWLFSDFPTAIDNCVDPEMVIGSTHEYWERRALHSPKRMIIPTPYAIEANSDMVYGSSHVISSCGVLVKGLVFMHANSKRNADPTVIIRIADPTPQCSVVFQSCTFNGQREGYVALQIASSVNVQLVSCTFTDYRGDAVSSSPGTQPSLIATNTTFMNFNSGSAISLVCGCSGVVLSGISVLPDASYPGVGTSVYSCCTNLVSIDHSIIDGGLWINGGNSLTLQSVTLGTTSISGKGAALRVSSMNTDLGSQNTMRALVATMGDTVTFSGDWNNIVYGDTVAFSAISPENVCVGTCSGLSTFYLVVIFVACTVLFALVLCCIFCCVARPWKTRVVWSNYFKAWRPRDLSELKKTKFMQVIDGGMEERRREKRHEDEVELHRQVEEDMKDPDHSLERAKARRQKQLKAAQELQKQGPYANLDIPIQRTRVVPVALLGDADPITGLRSIDNGYAALPEIHI